jgi:BMFP domain-containing protein YqiC
MQTDNPMISDFVKLLNSAAGTLAGMGREGKDAARERAREFFGGLDFVSRDEFEAVKAMAATAREKCEALEARLATLEAGAAPAVAKPGKAKPGAGITD